MDDWLSVAQRTEGMRAVFAGEVPSLDGIELWEARLTEWYSLRLEFDLAGYPSNPPEKWRAKKANAVRVELDVSPLLAVSVTRWGTCGRADLSLTRHGSLIEVVLDGPEVRLSATVEWAMVLRVSAYANEDRPPA
jgi:hypothetical protein